jgi:hypothetical protein
METLKLCSWYKHIKQINQRVYGVYELCYCLTGIAVLDNNYMFCFIHFRHSWFYRI